MHYDIVIIGGGPAGLAFARALAGAPLSLAVVERALLGAIADPAYDGREIALTHRSIATLKALGAWEHLQPAEIAPLREARVLNAASPFALSFDPSGSHEERLGVLVPNHAIRRSLFTVCKEQDNLTILTDATMRAVSTDASGARVELADGRTLEARLLVGADSRFSAVREQLRIGAEINRLGSAMMVCRVAHDREHDAVATEWFSYGQTFAMLPLNGRESSAVLTLPEAQMKAVQALDDRALGAELTRRFERRLGAMSVTAPAHVYPLATTWSHHFAADSAALIGDAAVGMHPVTAHGFNLGLRSADTLARRIAKAAARGSDIAAPMLLRGYEREHRLAARPIYMATKLIVSLFTTDHPAARLARHTALRAAARLPFLRQGVSRALMQHR